MSLEQPATVEQRYGWVMVGVASIFIGIGMGSLLTVSVFMKPLIAEFGWLRGQTALAYMAAGVSYGLGGIVMGYLSDRYSTRRIVLVGAVGLGASLLLLSNQSALWQLYIFYCLLGALGPSAFFAPLITNVGYWFDRNKGLALGVTTAGRAVGQGFVPLLAGYLISAYGWQRSYQTLAVFSWAVLLPLVLLVRTPSGVGAARAAARQEAASSEEDAVPIRVEIIVPWISAAAVFCCVTMATPFIHLVALAEDQGIDAQSAASVLTLSFIASFFGAVAFGKIADHIGSLRAYMLASAGQTAVVFWFTQVDSLMGFYFLAILFGLSFSGVITNLAVTVREMTPVHNRGVSLAIVSLFAWTGQGLGGYQGGIFFDLTGDYTLSYANAAAAGIINLIILAALYLHSTRKQAALADQPTSSIAG